MKKNLKKLLLVVGMVAMTTMTYAHTTIGWHCNDGRYYEVEFTGAELGLDAEIAICEAIRDAVC